MAPPIQSNYLLGFARRGGALLVSLLLASIACIPDRAVSQLTLAQTANLQQLELDRPIERNLAVSETHAYQMTISAGEYLHVVVEQRGIDIEARLLAPDGKLLDSANNQEGNQGEETLLLIASVSGIYRIEVGATDQISASGRYEIKIKERRSATDREKNLFAAKQAYAEGMQLAARETTESKRSAIAKYEEALKIYQTLGDRPSVATLFHAIGLTYYTLTEKQLALDYYNRALEAHRADNNRSGEANALWAIGGVYSDLSEKQKALDFYNQALSIFRDLGVSWGEAFTLQSMGQVYFELGETQKAIDFLNQALAIQQAANNPEAQATTLFQIATIYLKLGENEKASAAFERAKALQPSQQQADGDINSIVALVNAAMNSWSEAKTAIAALNQQMELQRSRGNRSLEAEILNQIGTIYKHWGENQKSLDSHDRALELQRAVGDRAGIASTLNYIGDVRNSSGEYQQALDFYNQALELQKTIGDRDGQAKTFTAIALVYSALGDYPLSIDSYDRALSFYREAGNLVEQAQTLTAIGGIYRLLENYPKAIESAERSLLLWRQQNTFQQLDTTNPTLLSLSQRLIRQGEIATLSTMVRIYESWENYQKALETAIELRSLGRAYGEHLLEASGLLMAGRIYRASGDYPKAMDAFNKGLEIFQKYEYRTGEAPTLNNIGKVYDALNDSDKAIASYTQAIALWRQLGDATGEAESLHNLAVAQSKRGNLTESLNQIEKAIAITEKLRDRIVSQKLRTSYFASVQKYYQFKIDLLMQLHQQNSTSGYDAKALQTSEQSRARSLLEILNESRAEIRSGVDPKLLESERTLEQQLDTMEQRRIELLSSNPSDSQKAELEKAIDAILTQYQQIEAQIRQNSPRYAALTQPQPLNLSEIQQQVIDENTLLLEYSLGEERSYLWAVSKTGISSYTLPKRSEIEASVRNFREVLTSPAKRNNPKQVAKASDALSQIILKPVASELGSKRLLVVADGALQYIPFSALTLWESNSAEFVPLIVNHEIVTLPSASTLAVLRRDTAGRKLAPKMVAMLADPIFSADDERLNITKTGATPNKDRQNAQSVPIEAQQLQRAASEAGVKWNRLPFTRTEAEKILALVPETQEKIAFDFAANRSTATSEELSQYRIVHFATHGFANSEKPELSGLVLSLIDEKGAFQNGYLRLHDIYNLNLPAELVVLSACQTGLGKDIKGEGLVSLTRGFMYAGAPRVVVSLWSVNDQATAELMVRFYQKMLKDGLAPASALRAAQVELLQQTEWKSPYYWAAFGLQGEWK